MSLLDNIKGRSSDEGDPGGKFNPFRMLDIGEIMVRYTDGIRIKDFVFLAILTSERLILIDSARQGTGQITKEIPFSVIKQADLERDERDRPSLAISMEVGGQQRVMRLVFTGLISEPDSECREWYTAINGYPPEKIEPPEIHLDEPADAPHEEIKPVPIGVTDTPVVESPPAAEIPVPSPPKPPTPSIRSEPERPVEIPVPSPAPVSTPQPPAPAPIPVSTPSRNPVQQAAARITLAPTPSHYQARQELSSTPIPDGSVRVVIEKPDISPITVLPKPAGEGRTRGAKSFKFCIHCGARTPSHARFCQACGNPQT